MIKSFSKGLQQEAKLTLAKIKGLLQSKRKNLMDTIKPFLDEVA